MTESGDFKNIPFSFYESVIINLIDNNLEPPSIITEISKKTIAGYNSN